MPRPFCVPCKKQMKIEENGVRLVTTFDDKPDQVWAADLWKCPECGREILEGYGRKPVLESWYEDFESKLALEKENSTIWEG